MKKEHEYSTTVKWTGNQGTGTSNYREFERSYSISTVNKPDIFGSSDPAFRGDKTKYNPEEFLVVSLSSCHMLWYLHLCSEAGVIVMEYADNATGKMVETANGGGHFTEVVLNPKVRVVESSMIEKANELHKKANELCFIANSVNFKVDHHPSCFCD
ncbi:OsmC family protein [Flagellimonas aequoris]|uniref:OsmC family peroxiredoxin n=1 Tax=Flagellimonas aequoris TaxID=2306997 RepID=A0A418N6J2_9FLAO|nr:OsmC family protein [Allomuricauda aequoris]RIV69896.1 OsmC family peroxiredoxin [Allomuricauda aequoris]TXK01483.1 OsmC family protein [Allomuricauda aequoris]